jgi:hypothetical protein
MISWPGYRGPRRTVARARVPALSTQIVALTRGVPVPRPAGNPTSAAGTSAACSSPASTISDSACRYALPCLTFAAGWTCPPGIWHMPAFPASFQHRGRPRRHSLQSPALVRRRSCSHPMEVSLLLQSTEAVKSAPASLSPLKCLSCRIRLRLTEAGLLAEPPHSRVWPCRPK